MKPQSTASARRHAQGAATGVGELAASWQYVRPAASTAAGQVRIGVIGAQGVGKTTLARLLARALDVPVLTEVARSAASNGLPLGSATTLTAQAAMWFAQFDLESRHPSYVADRTLLDVVTHSVYTQRGSGSPPGQLLVNALRNATAIAALEHYRLLIYVPPEFPLSPDGTRDTDADFQRSIDDITRETLDEVPVPRVRVTGTPAERLDRALAALDSHGSGP